MKRFLLWLTARLPAEEIAHQGEKFMERYYVATLLGWRFYIHRFIGSDPDGVHDHPWRWGFSLILCGWYFEQRREALYLRRWFNMVNGDTFHRIVMPVGREAWTLFAHNARCKEWGFLRRPQWAGFLAPPGDPSHKLMMYEPHNAPTGHSDWHKTAPKGHEIRSA